MSLVHRTTSLGLPPPSPQRAAQARTLSLACALGLAISILSYGTLIGTLAFGVTLGIHYSALRTSPFPASWAVLVVLLYVIVFAGALFLLPPVRIQQSTRSWLPREQIALCLRTLPFQPTPRTGDQVAYELAVHEAPLTLGIIAADEGQTLVVDRSHYRVNEGSMPTPAALSRLLTLSGLHEIVIPIAPGQLAILPTNLNAETDHLGDRELLAHLLPRIIAVPQRNIVGRVRSVRTYGGRANPKP